MIMNMQALQLSLVSIVNLPEISLLTREPSAPSTTFPVPSSVAIPVTDSSPASIVIVSSTVAGVVQTPSSVTAPSSTVLAVAAPSSSLITSPSSTIVIASITSAATVPVSTAASNSTGALQWVGVNESGAEFGSGNIPGVLGTDYTWPLTSSIDTLMGKGMNIFRVAFLMERLAQSTITAALDTTYLSDLSTLVSHITTAGGYAVLDPHNFGRYAGAIITSTADFKTFWTNVATEFKANDKVIFDCNNEFHDMGSNQLVADLNQACIDGIRAAGATTQYVFVEGTVSELSNPQGYLLTRP